MSGPLPGARRPAFDRGALALLAVYFLVTLPCLARYPAPWVDEGWIGEVAGQISRGLPPGNPSHGTLYRYNDRLFWMPPLSFYALGGWYHLAGIGLTIGRRLSVLAGAGALLLLYLFLRRHVGRNASLVGGLLFLTDTFVWKTHRTIRFEAWMALLSVALAWALDSALDREESRSRSLFLWIAAGAALGLMANVHPNAVLAALAAVLAVLACRRGGGLRSAGPWLAVGVAALMMIPYGLYCLGDAAEGFRNLYGQNSFHLTTGAEKGLAPLREWSRYAGFFPWPWRLPAAAGGLAIIALSLRGWRRPVVRLLLAFIVGPAVGLAFLPNKTLLYLVPLMPFVAALGALLWQESRGVLGRGALVALIAVNLAVDGGLLWRNRACDPEGLYAQIQSRLRPDDRVAGTFVTWWGVQPRPFYEFSRVTTVEAVRAAAPTAVILGDSQWRKESLTRFKPLANWFDQILPAAGTEIPLTSDPVMGPVRLYRLGGGLPGERNAEGSGR